MVLTSDQSHQAENMDPIQKSLDLWAQLFFPLDGNEIHNSVNCTIQSALSKADTLGRAPGVHLIER